MTAGLARRTVSAPQRSGDAADDRGTRGGCRHRRRWARRPRRGTTCRRRGSLGGRPRGGGPRGRPHAQPGDRRRQGGRDGRPVGGADARPDLRAGRRARRGDVPHPQRRRRAGDRGGQAVPLLRRAAEDEPVRGRRLRTGRGPDRQARQAGASGASLGVAAGLRARRGAGRGRSCAPTWAACCPRRR
jgi:hypothetical protein